MPWWWTSAREKDYAAGHIVDSGTSIRALTKRMSELDKH